MTTTASDLQAVLQQLPIKDREFASSLIHSVTNQRRAPSEKQTYWLGKLFERATCPAEAPERQTAAVGDMSGINAMFERIGKTPLKRPAIVLRVESVGDVRLNVAGAGAQVPGSLNVVGVDGGEWFGRITKAGVFEKSFKHTSPADLVMTLRDFARDPLEVAAKHGALTGKCCFCNHGLKDPKSTARGYGPVCAKAWVGR
jgi:hypothetical protein